jgi:hypothetical protein
MTTSKTIDKANIAIDILVKHSESNSKISFKELMDEIISKWSNDISNLVAQAQSLNIIRKKK